METTVLEALGFNAAEAALLCELTRTGPSTGYRLAHATGKSAANVYQALASLTQKGAVMVDDDAAKTYRAIPPAELLGPVRLRFEGLVAQAQSELEGLHAPVADDRVYRLKTVGQVYERARAMIDQATQIVLFDLFPAPLAALRPALLAAARRKVIVAGTVYDDSERELTALPSQGREFVAARWPGLQAALVVDGREHLVALLSTDGAAVKRGIWSDSAYLSCLQHSAMSAEIRLAARSPEEAEALSALSLLRAYPDGLKTLVGDPPAHDAGGERRT
jgi:HTH-type transcriptional regulator, sugar sensing transcriptional regulator